MAVFQPFFQGFLFSLSLCFDLGIVNVAIIKTGMERGAKPSFMIGFGSCFGDLFYLSLALIGVGVIFEITWIKWILWIAGSGFLFYLTGKMLVETWRPKELNTDLADASSRTLRRDWLAGLGLAMASPSVIAWFALVAGPIVAGLNLGTGKGLLLFVIGFFLAGLLWSTVVSIVSSITGGLFQQSMVRVLSLSSAVLFLYFAIRVFMNGLNGL